MGGRVVEVIFLEKRIRSGFVRLEEKRKSFSSFSFSAVNFETREKNLAEKFA